MRKKRLNNGSRSGQVLIETALILPLLLFILLGIFEFGRAWYYKNTLNNIARAGARAAVVKPNLTDQSFTLPSDCTGITDPVVLTICNSSVGIPRSEISVYIDILEKAGKPADPGDTVIITVTWNKFNPITFSYLGMDLKITNSLTGRAVMRYE